MIATPKSLSCLSACLSPALSWAQGTILAGFDGPPVVPRGSDVYVQSLLRTGFYFAPMPGSSGFVRADGGSPVYPDNRTAYLQATIGDFVTFSNQNRNAFL